jgi:hypothetical protein
VHDGYVQNDTAYFCHIYQPGFVSIVNLADKSNPVEIAPHIATPNTFPHNTWLTADHKTLLTTDEVSNSYQTAYDISDLNTPTEISRFQTGPGSGSIVHNVHVVPGDFAVTSWYTRGVIISDESRPHNPVEVGHYDTYPAGNGNGFNGDWGVYPFLPSGNLVVSDINNGLFVLGPTYVHACWLEGIVTDSITGLAIYNASVVLMSSPTVTRTSNITGNYYSGLLTAGTYSVVASKTGYVTKTITGVTLTNGLLTPLDIQLVPVNASVGEIPSSAEQLVAEGNPFHGSTFVSYSLTDDLRNHSTNELVVSDILGNVVERYALSSSSGKISVGEKLSAGVYFLSLMNEQGKSSTLKIVKAQ